MITVVFPVGMIRHDPHIEHPTDTDRTPTFTVERGRMLRFETSPHVKTSIVLPTPFDPGKPKTYPPPAICPTKTTPVTPGAVKVIIIRPGQLKVIATRSKPLVCRPIQFDTLQDIARRIG